MLTVYRVALDDATEIVDTVTADALQAPTPCRDWDLRQLLAHMIGQNEGFATAVSTGDAPESDYERDTIGFEELPGAWARSTDALRAAFGAADPESTVQIRPYGDVPVRHALTMQVLDTIVHSWDVAAALGQDYRPNDELVEFNHDFATKIAEADSQGAFAAPVADDGAWQDGPVDQWALSLRLLGRPTDAYARWRSGT